MRKQARAKEDARVLKDINCLSCGGSKSWSQRDRATHNNCDTHKTYNTCKARLPQQDTPQALNCTAMRRCNVQISDCIVKWSWEED